MSSDWPPVRIISNEPKLAEREIADLWKHYSMITVNIQPINDKPWITAVMVLRSEMAAPSPIALAMPNVSRR